MRSAAWCGAAGGSSGADISESREALAFPGERGRLVLLRRVEAVRGRARVAVLLDCRAGFGSRADAVAAGDDGVWTGRTGPLHLRWSGVPDDGAVEVDPRRVGVLRDDGGRARAPRPGARDLQRRTRRRRPRRGPAVAPHRRCVVGAQSLAGAGLARAARRRALLGGAARPDQPRRRDGRGRDHVAARARRSGPRLRLPLRLDPRPVLHRPRRGGCRWRRPARRRGRLRRATGCWTTAPHLVPAYTVDGDPVPDQHVLDLPGYPGAPEVYVGNHVRDQFQLDAFGEALLLFAAADRLDVLDADGWKAAEVAVGGDRPSATTSPTPGSGSSSPGGGRTRG